MSDAFKSVFRTTQKPHPHNEGLMDYAKRFLTATDALEAHLGGTLILNKLIEDKVRPKIDDDTTDEELTKLTDEARKEEHERLLTHTCLDNADKEKYG